MSEHLDTDKILTVGDALDWNVSDGLRHLQSCDECRAQLELLRVARASFADSEAVDEAVLRRVSSAVATQARAERERANARVRQIHPTEAILAGLTALPVLRSSGIPISSLGTAVLAFALGAVLMIAGRMLARRLPAFAGEPTHA